MKMIQERWVDGGWNNVEEAKGDGEAQLTKLRAHFAKAKAQIGRDAEFRVAEVEPDLHHKLLELLKDCPEPGGHVDPEEDEYTTGRRDGEAALAQKIRDLLR